MFWWTYQSREVDVFIALTGLDRETQIVADRAACTAAAMSLPLFV